MFTFYVRILVLAGVCHAFLTENATRADYLGRLQENNFQQPGERFRSFDPARKERFVKRMSEVVGDARCTKVDSPILL